VTGTAHGIGQAIAAGLAERGTRIVLGDIDEVSQASDLTGATGHPAIPVTPDVSDPSSIEAAHDRVTDPPGRVELQNVQHGRPVSRIPLDVTRRPHRTSGYVASRSAEPTAK
jgi:3-oxoacyl-[acyl-carrier protein] reductase